MGQEKTLDNKVMDLIESVNGWKIKYWGGSKYGKVGIPDILACVNSFFVAVEDKAPNGKPSLLQLKNLEWIRKAGGYGILLYPKDFEKFKRLVQDLVDLDGLDKRSWDWYLENIELQKEWIKKF